MKAAYGCVPYVGNRWSVVFYPEKTLASVTTSFTEGYGQFPDIEYSGLPVIEYNKATLRSVCAFLEGPIEGANPGKGGDLALYLWSARSLGIPVRRTK